MAYKKFLALGCSHGQMADAEALAAILRARDKWRPDTVIHLGDAIDCTAIRAGAKGSSDETASLSDDLAAGFKFLKELAPSYFLDGNHEDRIPKLLGHPNALTRYAAQELDNELNDLCRSLRCQRIGYDIETGYIRLGDTSFLHGYMFNQAAIRDHAETFGKCVIAHLHRVGQERGRAHNSPTAYCVGWLGRKELAFYAKTNRSRLAWSQGFAYGEYNDSECIVNLYQKTGSEWRLPF